MVELPFPDEENLYETHPSQYLSHVIGYKGSGSILSCLKTRRCSENCRASLIPVCSESAIFRVTVTLTDVGLVHYKQVVKTVFQYIAMIKEQPTLQWVFDEMKRIAELNFLFQVDERSPTKFTGDLSSILQTRVPRKWLLNGKQLKRFDASLIANDFSHLRGDNFRLMTFSSQLFGEGEMVRNSVPAKKDTSGLSERNR